MLEYAWGSPVRVETKDGAYISISTPEEAVDCLDNNWPVRDGRYFADARRICRAAATRATPLEDARDALVYASLEAYLRVH